MIKPSAFTSIFIALTLFWSSMASSQSHCQISENEFNRRIEFLESQVRVNKDIHSELIRQYDIWNENFEAMEWGHNVATVCAIASAAALTALGVSVGWTTLIRGEAIVAFGSRMVFATNASATAMLAGEVINITKGIIGMTYFFLARAVVMLPADAYLIYQDLFVDHTDFGSSIPAERIQQIAENSNLYGSNAMSFLSEPNWSGSSTQLNNPIFEKSIDDISNWQERTLEEIGDSWGIFEYFTKDYLEQSAANAQAYQIASDVQKFQVFYWNGLLSLMKAEKRRCYNPIQ